ncbi:MAG: hypothetical protein WDN24_16605 [Sphingomonas sp.]
MLLLWGDDDRILPTPLLREWKRALPHAETAVIARRASAARRVAGGARAGAGIPARQLGSRTGGNRPSTTVTGPADVRAPTLPAKRSSQPAISAAPAWRRSALPQRRS